MTESTMKVTVGSILGRSLNVTLKNFFPFLAIAVVFQLPNFLIDAFIVPSMSATAGNAVTQIADMVFGNLVTAGILFGVFQALRGNSASIGQCISVAMSRLVPVIVISIIYGIAVGIGLILLVVPGIIIACMWYVAIPVTVVEKAGIGAALSRSADLTKGYRMTLFLVFLVFVGIGLVLAFVVFAPLALAGSTFLLGLIAFAVAITIGLWSSATAGVAYHDLRIVKDGMGADELAEIFS